ncbi:MAG: glutamate--tRNA ligase family protein [Gemmatimonadales bacterium]
MPPIDPTLVPEAPVTRFAPSPTGRLHLGHVANAVWVWGLARARGGRVLLRIEDHDRGRCRPEFERGILEDLEWLGLDPNEPPLAALASGAPSSYRQSDNDGAYLAAVERLRATGRVFACQCSRKKILRDSGLEEAPPFTEVRYPGTCRDLGLAEGPGRGLRVRLDSDEVVFDDLAHGTVRQTPAAQCGDLLIRDPHGQWTYQLAVVVDDLRHGVDLVVRGDDLLESTGRQLMLRAMLDPAARPPAHLHHPLLFGPDPEVKLSKRDQAAGLDELRSAGWTPAMALGEAARRTGLQPTDRPIAAERLAELFR